MAFDSWLNILKKVPPESKIETETVSKEFFVSATGPNGTGASQSSPIRINGLLESVQHLFGDSCKITLLPGIYYTKGFKIPKRFILSGLDKDKTIIKLVDNCEDNFNFPHIRMIADNNWSEFALIKDLTLDGNWQNQRQKLTHGNFKIEPLVIKTVRGRAENLKIINFGSNGRNYGASGLEAFPLAFETFSNGAPFKYQTAHEYLIGKETQTYIEILNCEVSQSHFVDGGTCTAIFVKTNQGAGDRQPIGTRTTTAAIVKNCFASVPDGIGFGCAESERVIFENNVAQNCKAGFNHDTGPAYNIQISRNNFLNCHQGINFTPSQGTNLTIENNIFILSEPYFNIILNLFEEFYAVKAVNINSKVALNYCSTQDRPRLQFLIGVENDRNTFNVFKALSQTNGVEFENLKQQLNNARLINSESELKINHLKQENDNLLELITTLKAQIATLSTAIASHKQTVLSQANPNEILWKFIL